MTYEQRGMFVEMFCEQWDKGSLPDDPRAVAELFGDDPVAWISNWTVLRRNFVDRRSTGSVHEPTDHDASRQIVNLRLLRAKRLRVAQIRKLSESGRKGGLSKAQRASDLLASKAKALLSIELNSNYNTTKEKIPALSRRGTDVPDGFADFWQAYPKKKSRSTAEKVWRKLAPSPELCQRILDAVAAQRNSPSWLKDRGQYIPFPATWLNGKRWEDEGDEPAVTLVQTAEWFNECAELHGGSCNGSVGHRLRMQIDAAKVKSA